MALLERALPLVGDALVMTLFLGFTSFVIGSIIGLFGALGRLSKYRALRYLSATFVTVFRGTPLLVQILLIYFGLPQFGIVISPVPAAIIALSLHAGSYLIENFRSGVISVERGQREAAHSLSMTHAQSMRRIVLPQAIRIALPPVGNRLVALMKDTSLASVITVTELTRVASTVGSATFRYVEMFTIAAAVYLVINTVLSMGQEVFERRLARPY
jgi:L-cystine transport system permease protein